MVRFYALVAKIGVKGTSIADLFANGIVINLAIMFTACGLLYINDVQSGPLNDDLGLQRVPLFFMNSTLFGTVYRHFGHIYHLASIRLEF